MCKKIDTELSLGEMMMEFEHLKDTIKGLNEKCKMYREEILKKMGKNREVSENGYTATLIAKARETLSVELIEKVHGIKVGDNCYSKTHYDELRVKKI